MDRARLRALSPLSYNFVFAGLFFAIYFSNSLLMHAIFFAPPKPLIMLCVVAAIANVLAYIHLRALKPRSWPSSILVSAFDFLIFAGLSVWVVLAIGDIIFGASDTLLVKINLTVIAPLAVAAIFLLASSLASLVFLLFPDTRLLFKQPVELASDKAVA